MDLHRVPKAGGYLALSLRGTYGAAGQRASRSRGRIVDTASQQGLLMGRRWLVCGYSGRLLYCWWRLL